MKNTRSHNLLSVGLRATCNIVRNRAFDNGETVVLDTYHASKFLSIDIHRDSQQADCQINNSDGSENYLRTASRVPAVDKEAGQEREDSLDEVDGDKRLVGVFGVTVDDICETRGAGEASRG